MSLNESSEVTRLKSRCGNQRSHVLIESYRHTVYRDWNRVTQYARSHDDQYCPEIHELRSTGIKTSLCNVIFGVYDLRRLHVLRRHPRNLTIPVLDVPFVRGSTPCEPTDVLHTGTRPMAQRWNAPTDCAHVVTSRSSRRISSSACFSSASISSSGRGGVYL